jgi:hypothetical protein
MQDGGEAAMAESKRDPQATDRRGIHRNRTSSLRRLAASLPSADHALDELIARANQTELDIGRWSTFAAPAHVARGKGLPTIAAPDIAAPDIAALNTEVPDTEAPDTEPPDNELDTEALDVGLLEVKLRDAEAREQALRHQLDHVQGRIADAEARIVVAERAAAARPLPWLAVGCAFLGGLALMFAAGALQAREPTSAATPAELPKPIVTPIETPTVTPIEPPAAASPAATPPAADSPTAASPPVAAPAEVAPKPTAAGVPHDVVGKPRARPPAPPAAPAHAASPRGELADPFAEPAKPGDRPRPGDPPAPGRIVDPF